MNHTDAQAILQRGIAAYHAGDTAAATHDFVLVTALAPDNQMGWLWLAAVTPPAEPAYTMYLQRAHDLNPHSELGQVAAEELRELQPPPQPLLMPAPPPDQMPPPPFATPTNPPPLPPPTSAPAATSALDTQLLAAEVTRRTAEGWSVLSQTHDTAVFRRTKPINVLILIALIFVFAPLIALYVVYYIATREETVLVSVRGGTLDSQTVRRRTGSDGTTTWEPFNETTTLVQLLIGLAVLVVLCVLVSFFSALTN